LSVDVMRVRSPPLLAVCWVYLQGYERQHFVTYDLLLYTRPDAAFAPGSGGLGALLSAAAPLLLAAASARTALALTPDGEHYNGGSRLEIDRARDRSISRCCSRAMFDPRFEQSTTVSCS
jgi:hypothetical protein